MNSSLEEKVQKGALALVVLGATVLFGTVVLRMIPIERITYPKATSNLSIIETWSEKEVYSFSDDLGCFDIPYGEEFEEQFYEAVEFCRKVRSIWAEKYNKNKEDNMNWELYHSLDKGNEQ